MVPPVLKRDPATGIIMDNRRQSIAYFHNLNRDAVVEVFPTCIDEATRPCRYAPIKAFDHLMERHAIAIGATKFLKSSDEEEQGGVKAKDPDALNGSPAIGSTSDAGQKVGGADITGAAWKKAEEAEVK